MKKRIRIYSQLALILCWSLTLLGLFDGEPLAVDLASHFKLQYMLIGVLCLIAFSICKAYISLGLSIILILLNGYYIAPFYFADSNEEYKGVGTLKILVSNVLTSNTSPDGLINLINDESPDVVLLMEINQRWVSYMHQLKPTYSHSITEAREDNFGISLLSKISIEDADIGYFGNDSLPSIVARLKDGNSEITIIGTHPLPPINQPYYESRNRQLRNLSRVAKEWKGPLIIAGDFNTAMWSYSFKALEKTSGLHNTRYGFGVSPSWPSIASVFGIPIDHILVSKHFVTTDFKVGPSTGSDHRPIIVTLRLHGDT